MNSYYTWIVGLFLCFVVLSNPQTAKTQTRDEVINGLLVPTSPFNVTAIKRDLPNATQMLCNIATDRGVHSYARIRAIAALTSMGGQAAFDCLFSMAKNETLPPFLRRHSIYALGRRYAAEQPGKVIPVLQAALNSKDADEREKAVRALAYGKPSQVLPILEMHLATEKSPSVKRITEVRIEQLLQKK